MLNPLDYSQHSEAFSPLQTGCVMHKLSSGGRWWRFITISELRGSCSSHTNEEPSNCSSIPERTLIQGMKTNQFPIWGNWSFFLLFSTFFTTARLCNRRWAVLTGSSGLKPDWGRRPSEGHLFSLRTVFSIKVPLGQVQKLSSHCQMILKEAPVWLRLERQSI